MPAFPQFEPPTPTPTKKKKPPKPEPEVHIQPVPPERQPELGPYVVSPVVARHEEAYVTRSHAGAYYVHMGEYCTGTMYRTQRAAEQAMRRLAERGSIYQRWESPRARAMRQQMGMPARIVPRSVAEEMKASHAFWEKHGYPEYAGKYTALDVPSGYWISEARLAEEGKLSVKLAPRTHALLPGEMAILGPKTQQLFVGPVSHPTFKAVAAKETRLPVIKELYQLLKAGEFDIPKGASGLTVKKTLEGYTLSYAVSVPSAAFIGLGPEEAKYRVARLAWKRGEIPEDSIILDIKATKEGYAFTYMPTEEWRKLPSYVKEKREPTFWEIPLYKHLQKGFHHFWMEHIAGPLLGEKERERYTKATEEYYEIMGRREPETFIISKPIQSIEALVGGVGALTGHPTPRSYIPSAIGGLVSTGVSTVSPLWGGKGFTTEYLGTYWESIKEQPEQIIPELLFEVALGYFVVGPIAEKAWKGAKWVGGKVGIAKEVTDLKRFVKFSRAAQVYEAAKLKIKSHLPLELWAYRQKGLSVGEVALKGVQPQRVVGFGFGKEQAMLVLTHPETFGEYAARTLAWKLHQAPRMGGVILFKQLGPTLAKTKALPHLFFQAGRLSVGYLGELAFEKGEIELAARARANLLRMDREFSHLTPLVSQTLHTRMGIYPHVAKYIGGKKTFAPLIGLVTPQLMKLPTEPTVVTKEMQRITSAVVQKPRRKTRKIVTPKIELLDYTAYKKKLKQAGVEIPKQKARQEFVPKTYLAETAVPRIGEAEIVTQKEKQKQLQKLMLMQRLIQIQPTPERPPSYPPIHGPPIPIPTELRLKGFKRKPREPWLFGAWFKKRHPIATPEQVLSLTIGRKPTKSLKGLAQNFKNVGKLVSGPRKKRKRRKRR